MKHSSLLCPEPTLWAPGFGLPGLTVSRAVYWAGPALGPPRLFFLSFYLLSMSELAPPILASASSDHPKVLVPGQAHHVKARS